MRKFDKIVKKKLGALLVDAGLITYEVVEKALEEQQRTGEMLGKILVAQGHVKERDIAVVLARQFQLPFISLDNYQIGKQVVQLIPAEICHRHEVIALDKFGDVLVVAVSQNPTQEALDEIFQATNCELSPFVATSSEIQKRLNELLPYDAKVVAEKRKKEAVGPAGKASSWTDVFERADKRAQGSPTPPPGAPAPAAAAAAKAPAKSGALSISDIGEQRVTKRLTRPDAAPQP